MTNNFTCTTKVKQSNPRSCWFSCIDFPKCLLGQTNETYFPLIGMYSRILPFIIFGTVSIVAAVLSVLLPDTRNSKLPDLISEVKPIRGYACDHQFITREQSPCLSSPVSLSQSFGCLKERVSRNAAGQLERRNLQQHLKQSTVKWRKWPLKQPFISSHYFLDCRIDRRLYMFAWPVLSDTKTIRLPGLSLCLKGDYNNKCVLI